MLKFDCKSINENLESNLRKISSRSAFFGSALLSAVMLFVGVIKKKIVLLVRCMLINILMKVLLINL